MAGAGYKLFQSGAVLTASEVNTYLQEQAVMRFADAAARTTALSGVLAEGMVSYLDDTNKVQVYNGSSWVDVSGDGDITEVVAGTGLSGGGSSGSVTLTNTVATEFDAKGDLVVGTGADTFDKLTVGTNEHRLVADSAQTTGLKYVADTTNYAIAAKGDLLAGTAADTVAALSLGTNGQVLTVDTSTATGLKYATPSSGGQTLLSTTSLSGASTTVSSISTAYNDLLLIFEDVYSASDGTVMRLQFNNDTAAKYASFYGNNYDTDVKYGPTDGAQVTKIRNTVGNASSGFVYIPNYNNTVTVAGTFSFSYSLTNINGGFFSYNNAAAITAVTVYMLSGNISGGTLKIYGVK